MRALHRLGGGGSAREGFTLQLSQQGVIRGAGVRNISLTNTFTNGHAVTQSLLGKEYHSQSKQVNIFIDFNLTF